MRWPWSKPRESKPAQWYVHYQGFGSPEYVSPPMSEEDAAAELSDLRQFQFTFPPTDREFMTEHGPETITSFTGCRAWIDTSK